MLYNAIEMTEYQNRLFSSTRYQYHRQHEIAARVNFMGDSFIKKISIRSL